MVRFTLFFFLVIIACSVIVPTGARAADGRPNFVIIMTDDMGWGDLSINGNTNISTPRIDSLAKEGASFDRFYVCPVCSPTRAELLTGRYAARVGVRSTSAGGERLALGETTFAEILKKAGYATGAFGKWHNGQQHPYHPNSRGFDEYYGFTSGHWANYFDTRMDHNGVPTTGKGFIIDDLSDHAIGFIEKNKDRHFLCYVPYNTPHSPFQVPDRFFEPLANDPIAQKNRMADKEQIETTRAALAMVKNIDWNVGRILDTLKKLNLDKNTVVMFLSDNGPNSCRYNGDMRGRKGSIDEGGVRSPLLVRWPAAIEAGQVMKPAAAAIDFLPTLVELSGASHQSKKPLDGISIARLLKGQVNELPDRKIFSSWSIRPNRVSVRSGPYRAVRDRGLYNLETDPGQRTDISKEHPEVYAELQKAMEKWFDEVSSEANSVGQPFTVGHEDAPMTILPARDGRTTAGIKRSNRFPNASYFHGWTSTDDSISWNVEVLNEQTYEVEIFYTCAKGDEGARYELVFGETRLPFEITQTYDPPLIESPDRVKRMESYEKTFRGAVIGAVRLPKGVGSLDIHAVSKKGEGLIDVREIRLTPATREKGQ